MSFYIGLSILSNNESPPSAPVLPQNSPADSPAKSFKRALSGEARRVLSALADGPVTDEDIVREKQGRPYFHGREEDFSISHSGNIAAVSLVTGKGRRTGCDVQIMRPRSMTRKIAENYFRAPEREYIFSRGLFDESRFYSIWALKECFLKLKGFTILDIEAAPSFVSDGDSDFPRLDFCAPVSSPLTFYLYELGSENGERYALAAAVEGNAEEPPEIRWLSQSSLPCKSIAEIKAAPSPAETVSPKM